MCLLILFRSLLMMLLRPANAHRNCGRSVPANSDTYRPWLVDGIAVDIIL